jgi:peptidoglycan/xylan/chitin deacetylase (PgdA/CDA1 family)
MSYVRAAFVLAASVAAGTWLGLGRPPASEVTERARAALASASKAPAPAPSPSSSSRADPDGDRPVEFGQLPQERDPGAMPSLGAWPALNPDASIARAWMVAEGPAHAPGDGRRLVTLTFDDGPFLETTPSVLRVLSAYKLHATFFVIGEYLEGKDKRAAATRRLLKKIVSAGHLVGNHTWDHAHLSSVSHTHALEEIDRGQDAIEQAIGKRPVLFRPPFGELDAFGEQAAAERHLDVLLWNVEVNDMNRDDPHAMFRELAWQLDYKEGGIVLLHDIRFTSIAALRLLMAWLHEHRWDPKRPSRPGYDVVDLPTYLQAVAGAPLPYETRDDLERAREAAAKLRRRPQT